MVRNLAIFTAFGCVLLGLLYLRSSRNATALTRQVSALNSASQQQLAELAASDQTRERLQQQLLELDTELGATKTKLTATELSKIQIARELATARTEISGLAAEHASLRAEHAQLQQKLSAAQPVPRELISGYENTIARLERELAAARQGSAATSPVLATDRTRSTLVVSVGPSDAFVVLNYGADHGALPAQKFLLQRGTDTLGVALISDVRARHSIAQVDPQSLRGALHKGDSAVIAR
ncbi:MAG: hypothetical protein IT582_02530 [Opitutaceae bacterium]|nr:hypothetical protein [Opitutaceae bacterium]